MPDNFEARRFTDVRQAKALAEWTGGKYNPEELAPIGGHAGVVPARQAPGSKGYAELGDWLIKNAYGMVRVEPGGNQDGYCADCGLAVWWDEHTLVTRGGMRWCPGQDDSHLGMTHYHALAGMAQYVVRARDGVVCHCLDMAGPHLHQTVAVTEQEPVT